MTEEDEEEWMYRLMNPEDEFYMGDRDPDPDDLYPEYLDKTEETVPLWWIIFSFLLIIGALVGFIWLVW